jgi:hypothetical protein
MVGWKIEVDFEGRCPGCAIWKWYDEGFELQYTITVSTVSEILLLVTSVILFLYKNAK